MVKSNDWAYGTSWGREDYLNLTTHKDEIEPNDTLYVTAEDFYFSNNELSSLVDAFVKQGGKYLFVDEIHRYKNWVKELKLIYDYHPDLHIVFTGLSVLDIRKGAADLSRRAVMYHMQGLSFREYLKLFHQYENRIHIIR